MKIFVVRVTGYLPYPIVREYTVRATTFSTALARAARLYQKDKHNRKHLNRVSIQLVTNGEQTICNT